VNVWKLRWATSTGIVAAAAMCVVMTAPPALAQGARWSERTILQFDRPVMIPGKVLQPGTYIFQLANTLGDRDIMQVYTSDPNNPGDESNLIATTVTVPTKRPKANGDVVLKFSNTEGSEPIALKAFFYPGTLLGHQFVYPQDEAMKIAQATHTLVLSKDVKGADVEKGTLYSLDANGRRTAWQQDPDVARDWAAWVSRRQPSQHARTRWMHDNDAVGTSGHAASPTSNVSSEAHADAITRIVDQALHASGRTITVDRSTLEQIRSHAEAIRNGGGQR